MRAFSVVIAALLFSSCVDPYQDPELWPFILEFEEEYDTDIDFRVAIVEPEDNDWAGECKIRPLMHRVLIDRSDWDQIDERWVKRAVVFHELAHCQFWLKHDDAVDNEGRPTTYMNSRNPAELPAFGEDEAYYTAELRDRIRALGKERWLDKRGE